MLLISPNITFGTTHFIKGLEYIISYIKMELLNV